MSIQDVARQAGVSVATVSRVFNLPDKVTPATREHVEQVALALGYLPNASARTLRTQRSRVIGVVLPTLLNPVFAECLQGLAQAAVAAGYAILPFATDYQIAQEDRAVHLLLAGNVDGMVLVVSNPATSSALQRLAEAGLPYVLAYNRHPDHPCVSVDGEQAVAERVAHLVSLGHRRITMVSGQLAASDRAQQRSRGFHSGMAAAGLPVGRVLEVPFIETAVQDVTALLQGLDRPTALICSNDLLAIRSIRAAHLAGLAVPRDLSVVGFDGIALGEDLTPMLSTVAQPNADIGRCSVQLLVQAMASGTPLAPDAGLTLPHHFRTGESCAPA
ncbi:LacI family transcriptional regulator [Acidovorax sp. Leaf76]|uniref:LacI family DNA-binding transcriptional regulator n=1 Tax=unclassified Acidovorax TaxID=2684926 RepID=UPI0006F3F0D3|nr:MULTISPECIES: LacI family DNA-binding transcriptional regulator [unclassified Acidovorax]KQO22165.1 LacI family transcriptional regulator [Acidovorax sp. Leaf76]KQO35235.1 LacI family transcriptional regulator [Acidovorax sp. Leaf84]KQS35017.1 LacI family transcriptional regulator [Acidovorax sp. Leaf191]